MSQIIKPTPCFVVRLIKKLNVGVCPECLKFLNDDDQKVHAFCGTYHCNCARKHIKKLGCEICSPTKEHTTKTNLAISQLMKPTPRFVVCLIRNLKLSLCPECLKFFNEGDQRVSAFCGTYHRHCARKHIKKLGCEICSPTKENTTKTTLATSQLMKDTPRFVVSLIKKLNLGLCPECLKFFNEGDQKVRAFCGTYHRHCARKHIKKLGCEICRPIKQHKLKTFKRLSLKWKSYIKGSSRR